MRPIELAHCPPFRAGAAEVRPATREVVLPDRREVLEPRVMQVLVALVEAGGEILSRSDLNDLCWEGVAVSDHAMNRVISRLRALARETGAFEIETINKVGYRLTVTDARGRPKPSPELAVAPPPRAEDAHRPMRRAVLAGGGLAVAALLGAAGWWWNDASRRAREVDALVDHAWEALRRQREDETATAVSSLRLALEKDPGDARAWGLLALAYSWSAQAGPAAEARASADRARDAVARALELDPRSESALAARAWLAPVFGNWLGAEHACRGALAEWPRSALLLNRLTEILLQVGRWRDALPTSASLQTRDLFSPSCWGLRVLTLQDNGRIEEAEQATRQGLRLYPRHPLVWFTRLNFLADTGRTSEALAFLADSSGRPIGVHDDAWAVNDAVIRALDTRAPREVEAVMALLNGAVAGRLYPARRAIVFAASVGRLDDAYRMADAYFFESASPSRSTHVLFHRTTAAMRADDRFRPLTAKLGLDAYWQAVGVMRPA